MALTPAEHGLLERIDRSELTELLQQLVRHPSPNPPGCEASVARFLAETCGELGLRTEVEEVAGGRPNVYASLGPAGTPGLLFLTHTDTVPAGEGWTHPPFGGVVADGRVIGRGAADMKAGIAAAAIAIATLARSGIELTRPVTLAAVIDEEESGMGVRALLERPGFGALAAIVPEPTELQTIIGCRGNCYVDVEITGRSAHAGLPQEGRNAIYAAARVVEAIRRLHDGLASRRHPLLGTASWSVGLIQGGTSTAMVPDRCRISLDRRLLPGESGEEAQAQIDDAVASLDLRSDGIDARTELLMEIPSFALEPAHDLVRGALRASIDAGAPERPVAGWTAACDGGYLMRHARIPAVVLGPGSVVEQAHRPDESVPIVEVELAARTYALYAARRVGHVTP
ncbi:MAG TPA: M20 family metallopeptidase [Solirubrobacteraceae bacterium]|nr:M20 family metallopeptidase [Solirubrobacteraceae bacterium]